MPDNIPLMSQMVARAAQEQPLDDSPAPIATQPTHTTPSAKWPVLGALLGGAADMTTTQIGLGRGFQEANPLLPKGRLANGLALGGAYLSNALLTKYLNDHGHDKVAKVIGYGGMADGAGSAIHNIMAMRNR